MVQCKVYSQTSLNDGDTFLRLQYRQFCHSMVQNNTVYKAILVRTLQFSEMSTVFAVFTHPVLFLLYLEYKETTNRLTTKWKKTN
jgi:hypothetical protein